MVQIEGTVSTYAPLVLGPPMKKREAHLSFRKQEEGAGLNTLLALTAGQMVWSAVQLPGTELICIGLYQAIVRNSIPLFVTKKCKEKLDKEHFLRNEKTATAFEATVTGKVIALPWYLSFLCQIQLDSNTDANLDVWNPNEEVMYGIVVGVEHTSIRAHEGNDKITKYLDGDIWVVVEKDGERRVETRFCNLADRKDIDQQLAAMEKECSDDKSKIVARFDRAKCDTPLSVAEQETAHDCNVQ